MISRVTSGSSSSSAIDKAPHREDSNKSALENQRTSNQRHSIVELNQHEPGNAKNWATSLGHSVLEKLLGPYFARLLSSMKRNKTAELEEIGNNVFTHRPSDRVTWDWIVLFCCIAMIFIVPFRAAYTYSVLGKLNIIPRLSFVFVVDLLLAIDTFIVNPFTGFIGEAVDEHTSEVIDILVLNDVDVLSNYFSGLFFIDVVGVVASSVEIGILETWIRTRGIACMLKMFYVIRMWRVTARLNKYSPFYALLMHNDSLARIMSYMGTFLVSAHWLGCVLFFLGRWEYGGDIRSGKSHPYTETWVHVYQLFDADQLTQYANSVYWAMATLTTVGYGDIAPQTNTEKLVVAFSLFFGAFLYASVFGSVTVLMQNLNRDHVVYSEKIATVEGFIKHHHSKFNEDLQRKILAYTDFIWETNRGIDQDKLINELPEQLAGEIKLALIKPLLNKVDLFKGVGDTFIREVINRFRFCLCLKDDFVFREGDVARSMYFLDRGVLCVIVGAQQKRVATLLPGAHFGEIGLFSATGRTAGIKAVSKAEYYALDAEPFNDICNLFPEIGKQVRTTAERRLMRDKKRTEKEEEAKEKQQKIDAEKAKRAKDALNSIVKGIIAENKELKKDPSKGRKRNSIVNQVQSLVSESRKELPSMRSLKSSRSHSRMRSIRSIRNSTTSVGFHPRLNSLSSQSAISMISRPNPYRGIQQMPSRLGMSAMAYQQPLPVVPMEDIDTEASEDIVDEIEDIIFQLDKIRIELDGLNKDDNVDGDLFSHLTKNEDATSSIEEELREQMKELEHNLEEKYNLWLQMQQEEEQKLTQSYQAYIRTMKGKHFKQQQDVFQILVRQTNSKNMVESIEEKLPITGGSGRKSRRRTSLVEDFSEGKRTKNRTVKSLKRDGDMRDSFSLPTTAPLE
eukprot:g3387.t1